jgi:opacity protein-like surface antigen
MYSTTHLVRAAFASCLLLLLPGGAGAGDAQSDTAPTAPRKPQSGWRLGVQGFGGAALAFPVATDSFDAAALDSRPLEAGGGAQVTNIWRSLFVQVAYSRWDDVGERAFVDSQGNRFGLGIPLNVKATHVDVTAGWRVENLRGSLAARRVVPYVGAGVGILNYKESSPFALPNEDLDERSATYHAMGGAEYWIFKWLAVAGDVRYRVIRDVLGSGGVSSALEEDAFDGTSVAVRILIGPGGPLGRRVDPPRRRTPARPAPRPEPAYRQPPGAAAQPQPQRALTALTITETPIFVLPDERRPPIKVLQPQMSLKVREDRGEWLVVEFLDPQWGPRVGYVQRKHVQMAE